MGSNLGGDVAIVGAGLIGLAIAFELTELGATVRVYERGEPGQRASWAGAGMLAPHTERIEDDAMLALCAQSLSRYPQFVERVRDAGGIDPHLRLDGIATVAFDDAQLETLRERAHDLAAHGVRASLLDRIETREREPVLGDGVRGALLVEGEGALDNRLLGRALHAACEARGVLFMNEAQTVAVACDARRVLGIRSSRGFAPAAVVINAAGAWASDVEGIPQSCRPPVTPVKGQMLALATPPHFVRSTTWVPGAYLVPRDDGRLLIGATVEREGYDERVTASGIGGLMHAALAAAPSLAEFTVSETWAGLRPWTPDERPILGPAPLDGLVLATGHYRNGILLAPQTAHLIAMYVATGDARACAPFSLGRFAAREGARATS